MHEAGGKPVCVDSHAHVFRRDLPLVVGHRYAPQHDALLDDLLAMYDRHGITHGVLTAPSFYGTDNSYLLDTLSAARGRLRATVIVDSTIGRRKLAEWNKIGVVGIRFNMLQVSNLPNLRSPAWRRVLETVVELDWHVEIYIEGPRLPVLLLPATEMGAKVVVNHFGSPDPAAGVACGGFRALLTAIKDGRTWVKLSAPFRLGGGDVATYAQALLAAGGPERLVWGSDWPWTQNSEGLTYIDTLRWLSRWIPDPGARARILGPTPWEIFGFSRTIG